MADPSARHGDVPLHGGVDTIGSHPAPYPPGIPVLAPGERVTSAALEVLWSARANGARIAYAADPRLDTVQVVRTV